MIATNIATNILDRSGLISILSLPKRELILRYLLEHMDRYMTAAEIGHALGWDIYADTKAYGRVKVHIYYLRRRLKGTEYAIHNKYGLGYQLVKIDGEPCSDMVKSDALHSPLDDH